jgi:hypothetical protein
MERASAGDGEGDEKAKDQNAWCMNRGEGMRPIEDNTGDERSNLVELQMRPMDKVTGYPRASLKQQIGFLNARQGQSHAQKNPYSWKGIGLHDWTGVYREQGWSDQSSANHPNKTQKWSAGESPTRENA